MQQSRTSRGVLLSLLITAVAGCFSGNTLDAKPPPQPREEPSGRVNYDSGYFATPITIPDDPRETGITNITLECPHLTGQGGDATISFRNSKATFNDFGDAEVVQERQTREFDVTLTPISVADTTGEGRRVFNVVFADGRWTNRIYFVWSPETITTSRLLIRSGDGKLPEMITKVNPGRPDGTVGLTHVLPTMHPIARVRPFGNEDFPDELALQSYHFQSEPIDDSGETRQESIKLYGSLSGPVVREVDHNYIGFNPFGDARISTMMGSPSRKYKPMPMMVDDPVGKGRRLFNLEYLPRHPRIDAKDDPRRPPYAYRLVLAPKIDGPHRLIVRRDGKLLYVLPLYDGQWQTYLRNRMLLADRPKQEQSAISEIRSLLGNRFRFQIEDGQLARINFWRGADTSAALKPLAHLPQVKHLTFLECQPLTPSDLQQVAKLTQLESLSLVNMPVSDDELISLSGLKRLRWLDLRRTRVTNAGIARFREAVPDCKTRN